ncbi:MAG: hypothetical protein P8Y97_08105 [Candidatus Lokiarchaeota archaeon]
MNENIHNREDKVKAVIIASSEGIPLVSVKVDEKFKEDLIAPFFSAIKNFSEEQIGTLNESLIKGGDSDVLVVHHHNLILIAIMDSSLQKQGINEEAKEALDIFYKMYEEEIETIDKSCLDLTIFKRFEVLLEKQIKDYYEKIDENSGEEEGDKN